MGKLLIFNTLKMKLIFFSKQTSKKYSKNLDFKVATMFAKGSQARSKKSSFFLQILYPTHQSDLADKCQN
jgi:hypothetical protein